MDYAALAKQYGGSTAAPAVDYAALAKQFGGSTAALPETGPRKTGTIVDQIPGYDGPVPAAQTAPQLTTGQKIYRNVVRPVAAPFIEAGGAIGGGIAGTALGPMGTVGGAGLGYCIAKEALETGKSVHDIAVIEKQLVTQEKWDEIFNLENLINPKFINK
jgi:hypothetical protein